MKHPMKTSLFLLVLCLCTEVSAQTITVPDVEALPGETVAFTLNLTGGREASYTAVQFDAQFPATGFDTAGSNSYTVSPQWNGATSYINNLDESGLVSIGFANSSAIIGSDVEGLISVNFVVASNLDYGDYVVTLKNISFGYNISDYDYAPDVTFTVNVVEHHSVLLDETSTTPPIAATDVNVRVKRTISANEWSTICLPFAMTEEQVKSAFGADAVLADFIGYEATEEDGDIVGISVNFDKPSSFEANHPYLIKVSAPVSEFSVAGVDIDPEEEPIVATVKRTRNRWSEFIGTYAAETEVPEYCLFISNNKFYYSTGSTKMKAYRGYFDFYDVLTEVEDASSAKIRFVVNGEESAVHEINAPAIPKGVVYNMNGQIMGTNLDIISLPKGLYIVDGKKIMNN